MSWFAVTKNQKKVGSLAHVFHFLSRVKQDDNLRGNQTTPKYYYLYYFYDELDNWDRRRTDSYIDRMMQEINEDIQQTRKMIRDRLSGGGIDYYSERQYRLATEKPMVDLFKEGKMPKKITGFDKIKDMSSQDILEAWKVFRAAHPEFCKMYLTTHPVPRFVTLIKDTTRRSRW